MLGLDLSAQLPLGRPATWHGDELKLVESVSAWPAIVLRRDLVREASHGRLAELLLLRARQP